MAIVEVQIDSSCEKGSNQEHRPTIAERLAHRERFFFDGPTDLSEREQRKKGISNVVGSRHENRQQSS